MARSLVGTEGTCAIVLETRARLIPSPQHHVSVCAVIGPFCRRRMPRRFWNLSAVGLEGFEGSIVDGLKRKGAPHLDLLPEGRGYLLVEFGTTIRHWRRSWLRSLPHGSAIEGAARGASLHAGGSAARATVRESGPTCRRVRSWCPGGWDSSAMAPES